jgi:hypothetical protein
MASRTHAIWTSVRTVLLRAPQLIALLMTTAVVGSAGCAPQISLPPTAVRRIAVLPPTSATGGALSGVRRGTDGYDASSQSVSDLLAAEASQQLAHYGYDVVDPAFVTSATRGRLPSSPEIAAEIVRSAKLDANPLLIRVRRWEFPYPTMRTSEILVSLDVMLVDPTSGRVVWQAHRPTKPVPLHGALVAGQADAVAAQEVMKEVLAPFGQRRE